MPWSVLFSFQADGFAGLLMTKQQPPVDHKSCEDEAVGQTVS
jgi:hypothetical protein